jgi:hypothetical protein
MKNIINAVKKNIPVLIMAGLGIFLLFYYVFMYRPGLIAETKEQTVNSESETSGYEEMKKKIALNKKNQKSSAAGSQTGTMIPVNNALVEKYLTGTREFVKGRSILKDRINKTAEEINQINHESNIKRYNITILYKGYFELGNKSTALIEIKKIRSMDNKSFDTDIFGLETDRVIKIKEKSSLGGTGIKVALANSKGVILINNRKEIFVPINRISNIEFIK